MTVLKNPVRLSMGKRNPFQTWRFCSYSVFYKNDQTWDVLIHFQQHRNFDILNPLQNDVLYWKACKASSVIILLKFYFLWSTPASYPSIWHPPPIHSHNRHYYRQPLWFIEACALPFDSPGISSACAPDMLPPIPFLRSVISSKEYIPSV